jgi:hypothetical protein
MTDPVNIVRPNFRLPAEDLITKLINGRYLHDCDRALEARPVRGERRGMTGNFKRIDDAQ